MNPLRSGNIFLLAIQFDRLTARLARVTDPKKIAKLQLQLAKIRARIEAIINQGQGSEQFLGFGVVDYPLPPNWIWIVGAPYVNNEFSSPRGDVGFYFTVDRSVTIRFVGLPDPFGNPAAGPFEFGPTDSVPSWQGRKSISIDLVSRATRQPILNTLLSVIDDVEFEPPSRFTQIGNNKWWSVPPVTLQAGELYLIKTKVEIRSQALAVANPFNFDSGPEGFITTGVNQFLAETLSASWVNFEGIYGSSDAYVADAPEFYWYGIHDGVKGSRPYRGDSFTPGPLFASSLNNPSEIVRLTSLR
jgi:hypothetical protein